MATLSWCKRNRERAREITRRWREANREKTRENTRRSRKLRLDRMYQPSRPCPAFCEVCGGPPSGRWGKLHLDHDHTTDKFRGWLCSQCNVGIGMFDNSIERLRNTIHYLKANT